ncbi:MAG: 16S rRNA (cytosine(1402)-N(4))-methyltransferase RsmH [Deltaproteobacteria bacterium]|nr:16S rRNA (cytosine(1402)-N(4))-methyltransferase RsmH [Deltaproteobacteria bacterium]
MSDAGDRHEPVLGDVVADWLVRRPDGLYVDATIGRAGHALAILARLGPRGRLLGIDRDPAAVRACQAILGGEGGRVVVMQATFRDLPEILASRGQAAADGLVADLGLSSPQIGDPARGFSFRAEGPLDMRADPTRGETARELIERKGEPELADILFQLGEERQSRRIARAIRRALADGALETTADLRRAVHRATGSRPRGGIDPATRTFQALRMAVNDELGQLDALLASLGKLLAPGGRAAILSYHSLEDRRVKNAFRSDPLLAPLTKKPIVPDADEIARNPRARSAKLRVAERTDRS